MQINVNKLMLTKRSFYKVLFGLVILFSFRLFLIDCDLPSWGIASYAPVDEGTYASMAINYYNYGEINVQNQKYNTFTAEAHRNNVMGNLLNYLSLKAFGDNYFGLRFPSFIWTGLSLLLLTLLLLKNLPEKKWKYSLVATTLFIAIMNFQFLLASRVVEPSSVRMFFVMLLIYTFFSELRLNFKFFILGFLATISVMLVYITNAFFFFPCGCFLLYYFFMKKKFFLPISFGLGCCLAYLISETYYYLIWDTFFLKNALNAVFGFANIQGYQSSSSLGELFTNIWLFIANNHFFYDVLSFILFTLSIPVALMMIKRLKNANVAFLLLLVLGLFLQTLHAHDYIFRKFLVLYPAVLLLINLTLPYFSCFYRSVRKIDLCLSKDNKIIAKSLNVVILAAIIVLGLSIIMLCNHSTFNYEFKKDFSHFDRSLVIVFMALPLLYGLFKVYQNRNQPFYKFRILFYQIIGIVFIGEMVFNLVFSLKHVFLFPTYAEKQTMLDLKEKIKDKYLIGEWSYGYTLYNDIKPVEAKYDDIIDILAKDSSLYLLLYANHSIDPILLDKIDKRGYKLNEVQQFKRYLWTYGRVKPYALYKLVKKHNVSKRKNKIYKGLKK